jgi:hypothetical protein
VRSALQADAYVVYDSFFTDPARGMVAEKRCDWRENRMPARCSIGCMSNIACKPQGSKSGILEMDALGLVSFCKCRGNVNIVEVEHDPDTAPIRFASEPLQLIDVSF